MEHNTGFTSYKGLMQAYITQFLADKAILKKMSVGGNPSCCNLEAPLEKFFQVFLRFTKIYFNDNH